MSPDEDESTSVATAEPEAGPESQQLVPPETQPGPDAEQEPPPSDETEGEGAASATEDEGGEKEGEPLDIQAQLAAALKELPPDVLKAALPEEEQERLRAPEQEPQDATEVEVRGLGVERQGRLQKMNANLENMRTQAWGPLQGAFGQFTSGLETQAKAVQEGNAQAVNIDPKGLQQALSQFQYTVEQTYGAYTQLQNVESVQAAIESHSAFRYLSAEDKQAIAGGNVESFEAWAKNAIDVALTAALERGAPEETKRQAKAAAEKDAGLTDKTKALLELLGQNGATQTKGAEAGSAGGKRRQQPRDEAEARNWHAEGKWDSRQMREYLTRAAK